MAHHENVQDKLLFSQMLNMPTHSHSRGTIPLCASFADVHEDLSLPNPNMDDAQVHIPLEFLDKCVCLLHVDVVPCFIPFWDVLQVKVSEYFMVGSFHLKLHIIVVFRDIMGYLESITSFITYPLLGVVFSFQPHFGASLRLPRRGYEVSSFYIGLSMFSSSMDYCNMEVHSIKIWKWPMAKNQGRM